tara:strand:+ start:2168 stop:2809 length:642 start_codon:yes stop_codon:yes gene_type:complete
MIYDIDIAQQVARSLLQINAIILQPNKPFKWASGWNSPIYCDNRKTLSFPEIRTFIRSSLASAIQNHFKGANLIAGVATAGIPHGTLVAEELGLPFIYVRSKAKNHGKQNQIEGYFEKGQSVILIEDLISSGKSSLEAVSSLRKSGLKVKGLVSIFNYGFELAKQNFTSAKCDYISLCDYENLLPQALKTNYITKTELPILQKWRENPSKWNI